MFEFDRPKSGERTVLVHMAMGKPIDDEEVQEFYELATSAGALPIEIISGNRSQPDVRLFVGKGKAEEIKELVDNEDVGLVIFDHNLSPSQERNLESYLECRVLDRSGLILDIFAQRARSFEGKLQVELAQLRHLSTRLVRGWTHLERQKGGIGLRGPGETQLETDRRLLHVRILQIKKRLEKVASQRSQGRRARGRAEIPTVSVVGYTNAGKSTLFNKLTDSDVYAEDQLFATLDPTMRRLDLPDSGSVVLADTVGFVSRLPHELITAFKSTLQETVEADLLLHVVDDASHLRQQCIAEVDKVLEDIGAGEVPQIKVYNKIDLVDNEAARIELDSEGQVHSVWLSAKTGEGIDELLQVLKGFFHHEYVKLDIHLSAGQGRLRALLHQNSEILGEEVDESGHWNVSVKMLKRTFDELQKKDEEFLGLALEV